jgi:hypothetical protein
MRFKCRYILEGNADILIEKVNKSIHTLLFAFDRGQYRNLQNTYSPAALRAWEVASGARSACDLCALLWKGPPATGPRPCLGVLRFYREIPDQQGLHYGD